MEAPHDTATILQDMYAAEGEYLAAGGPGTASFDLLKPYFAEDVELHQADALPYGGTWHGHDGMERFFLVMRQTWAAFDLSEQEFLATTQDRAVVLTHVRARARATGTEIDFPILQIIRTKDGRITDIRPFYWDTAAISAACTKA